MRLRMTYSFRSNPSTDVTVVGARDEQLAEDRCGGDRAGAQAAVVGRDVAPAKDALAFLADDALDDGLHLGARRLGLGQEHETGAVGTRGRELEAQRRRFPAEEAIRHLNQDAGTVAGVRLAAAGPAMLQVDQDLEGLADDRVGAEASRVDNEPDAAGVVLVPGVVEALGRGRLVVFHRAVMGQDDPEEKRILLIEPMRSTGGVDMRKTHGPHRARARFYGRP